ncbi:unnamed protein product [Kuraishia capsulata CBS 1993]|uniref:EF-hand domain-containing protein n=1 Tax=Kuraishia capsulata CBS 1993 TaxID=1382522 RepID=W6MQM8_9ASCO|nr:uncharacterized protein KUCA_T00000155001 [Kuraishia capsulata CBS 1993]CDK24195.1 unnamed protein product [Kuraishia capsulata CBS 1993]
MLAIGLVRTPVLLSASRGLIRPAFMGPRNMAFRYQKIGVCLRNYADVSGKPSEEPKDIKEVSLVPKKAPDASLLVKVEKECKRREKKFLNDTVIGKFLKYSVIGCSVFSFSILLFVGGVFIYDYTTYADTEAVEHLLVPELALNPPRGGPENLPILSQHLDSFDNEEKEELRHRPKLVVLGSGWGSVSLLETLDPNDYDVTVISPTNYFLFTPMLPSAAVGTLELKSLVESIRNIIRRVNGHYLEANAEKILFSEKLIKVSVKDAEGKNRPFYVPYDKLVVAVGSTSNTHGVQGLQYSHQLKTAEDALTIRKKIACNLERACLPTTSDEERKKLLSFVICGAGPTGVEVAAEIFDLLNEDLCRGFPKILRQEISIHIIQSRSHILNTYDKAISEYAMKRFENDSIDLLTNSRVKEILPDEVVFDQKNEKGEIERKSVPFGLCLWSTGVAQNPLAQDIVKSLKSSQQNRRAIETDTQLRVIGAPLGDVYAIGDCSTVRTDLADHTAEYVRQYIHSKHYSHIQRHSSIITDDDIRHVNLSHTELKELSSYIQCKNPIATEALALMHEFIPKYDTTNSGHLSFDQVKAMLKEVDSKVTSLPATAQRAHQQGKYLGKKLSKLVKTHITLSINDIVDGDIDNAISKPFKYTHLGSLAYIGNSAVLDLPGYQIVGGLMAMYLWRSIYFTQSVSMRTRVLLFMDWLNRGVFGRDILSI